MANLNKVFIIGNVTRDPEMRYTPKGTAVTEIDVAVNRTWTGEDGQKNEEVTFISVTFWARLAEIAQQYLKKGSPLFVEGRLQLDSWEKDGKKYSKLKVVGENLQLLGSRQDSEGPSARGPARPSGSLPPRTAPAAAGGPEPDDIPF